MRLKLPGLMSAIALVFVASLACSDSGGDNGTIATSTAVAGPATATRPPPATATSAAPTCPINPAACTLAINLRGLLTTGNVAGVTALNRTQSFPCPGVPPIGPGGPFPLCSVAPAGEARTGLQTARRYSEGFVLSTQQYETILRALLQSVDAAASDPNGSGALDLYAVSCLDAAAVPQTCARFAVIFSAIFRSTPAPPMGTISGRELLLFHVDVSAGTPQIVSTWTGIIMPNEAQIIFRDGGTLFDLGRVYVFK